MEFKIQFRGQRINSKEWVFGYYFQRYSAHFIYVTKSYLADNKTPCKQVEIQVSPESVGLLWNPSVNLFVYSGDLLMAECSPSGSNNIKERLCKVVFNSSGFNVVVLHKNEWWAYQCMRFTTARVVGNIIDNPELFPVKL